jgi:hypothetical protein
MNIEDIKRRIDELIDLAGKVIATHHQDENYHNVVSYEHFNQLRSLSLSFLRNIFGQEHPFYKEFDKTAKEAYTRQAEVARGILKAAKSEIDGGWIFTLKELVSAEIFSDFLEMSDYLLKEGFKDAAAVMIGSVLEEHLRHLCTKNSIPVEIIKGDKPVAKKADTLNSELAAISVYSKLDQKSVTSWLALRNNAAHGKYSEYSKEQVDIMYQGVTNFISRTT